MAGDLAKDEDVVGALMGPSNEPYLVETGVAIAQLKNLKELFYIIKKPPEQMGSVAEAARKGFNS